MKFIMIDNPYFIFAQTQLQLAREQSQAVEANDLNSALRLGAILTLRFPSIIRLAKYCDSGRYDREITVKILGLLQELGNIQDSTQKALEREREHLRKLITNLKDGKILINKYHSRSKVNSKLEFSC